MGVLTSASYIFWAATYALYYVLVFFSGVLGMYVSYSVFETKFTAKGRKRVARMMSDDEEPQVAAKFRCNQ